MCVAEITQKFSGDFCRRSYSNDDVGNDLCGESMIFMKLTTGDSGITRVPHRMHKLLSAKGIYSLS